MENKKVNVRIEGYEDKLAKTGVPYTRFKTNEGWMSCFESELAKKLKGLKGQIVSVNIAIDEERGFKNIRTINGVYEEDKSQQKIKEEVVMKGDKPINGGIVPKNNTTAMYVSYAKDIFCAMVGSPIWQKSDLTQKEKMQVAIELVKQAREAFEK